MSEAVFDRARDGDEQAFRELIAPYRGELQLHCYRILGSLTDAEDMLQETLLAAWRNLDSVASRRSLRAWLYRIATNRCLNCLRAAERRRPPEPVPPFDPPEPTRRSDITWLQPYPTPCLRGCPRPHPDPRSATTPRRRFGWRSSPACNTFHHGKRQCWCSVTCSAIPLPRSRRCWRSPTPPPRARYSGHPLAATKLAGRRLLADADVVLVVGSRFRKFDGTPLLGDPAVPVVHLDADPATLSSRTETDVPVLSDARLSLALLAKQLDARPRPSRAEPVAAAREWAAEQVSAIQPQQAYLDALRTAMPADGILVSELTQVGYLVRVGFPVEAPRTNITPGYQGTLGFGFPTALGAKRGNPDRAVVSINGDGGFGWCLQELATAHQHGIGVVAVVFNDSGYGNIRRTQHDLFSGRLIGTDLVNPDFVALARAFHVRGERVSTPRALADAVAAAIAADEPTVIEVPVSEMPDPWHLLG